MSNIKMRDIVKSAEKIVDNPILVDIVETATSANEADKHMTSRGWSNALAALVSDSVHLRILYPETWRLMVEESCFANSFEWIDSGITDLRVGNLKFGDEFNYTDVPAFCWPLMFREGDEALKIGTAVEKLSSSPFVSRGLSKPFIMPVGRDFRFDTLQQVTSLGSGHGSDQTITELLSYTRVDESLYLKLKVEGGAIFISGRYIVTEGILSEREYYYVSTISVAYDSHIYLTDHLYLYRRLDRKSTPLHYVNYRRTKKDYPAKIIGQRIYIFDEYGHFHSYKNEHLPLIQFFWQEKASKKFKPDVLGDEMKNMADYFQTLLARPPKSITNMLGKRFDDFKSPESFIAKALKNVTGK
ncbi:MAG: hypothetical protein NUV82_01255 [Candidatus Komeilibacteria bacterium]|nr:hypothetical protein [Candidatus Komeilibacteria bacterium]